MVVDANSLFLLGIDYMRFCAKAWLIGELMRRTMLMVKRVVKYANIIF